MNDRDHDRRKIDAMLGSGRAEVGCDECFELLDQYVDLELAGESVAERLPTAHAHFEGCPVCRDEYESLRELVSQGDRFSGSDLVG